MKSTEYRLFIIPSDEAPWLIVPESAVNLVPSGTPETIDVKWPMCAGILDDSRGEVLLRFRPTHPGSRTCYLVTMLAEYRDGYLNKYSRSL